MSKEFRMLVVYLVQKEKWMEVKAGSRDIYTRVPAISWINLFCWVMNTKRPSVHLPQPLGTIWMRILEMRFSTCTEECLRRRALLLHHTPLLPLKPHASRSTLSSSQVVPTVQPLNTATNTPSGGKSTCTWCHWIENTSLFALRCFYRCQRAISTRKLKICTIDSSKYCAMNDCSTMISVPRIHQHPSSGANIPSDIAVTVNFNAEINLMADDPIIESFSRDLISEYCQGLESSAVYTAPSFFVESLHSHSNRSLPSLRLHMHSEDIIPTFLMSNIYIRLWIPNALTLTWLRL